MARTKSLLALPLICCIILLVRASCKQTPKENYTGPSKPVILLLLKDYDNEFFKKIDAGFRSQMTALLKDNYTLDLRYGLNESDTNSQGIILNQYTSADKSSDLYSKLKVAVITPAAGNEKIAEQIKPLNDDNIPVIILDLAIDPQSLAKAHAHYDVFIGSENKTGGQLAADEMVKHLPNGGTILVLNGVSGVKIATERRDGFINRLAELAKKNSANYKIIEKQANYMRSEASSTVTELLKKGTMLDGVFAVNDQMALGCLEALKEANNDRIIVVIGFDAIQEAIAAVKDGRLAATIVQDPYAMGQKAAIAVDQILQHKQPDKKILLSPKVITGD